MSLILVSYFIICDSKFEDYGDVVKSKRCMLTFSFFVAPNIAANVETKSNTKWK